MNIEPRMTPLLAMIEELIEAVFFLADNAPGPYGQYAREKTIEARAIFQEIMDRALLLDVSRTDKDAK